MTFLPVEGKPATTAEGAVVPGSTVAAPAHAALGLAAPLVSRTWFVAQS
jgi:hypothetical protein